MFKKTLFAVTVVALCSASALSQAQEAQPYLFASLGQSDADLSTGDVVRFARLTGTTIWALMLALKDMV